MTRLAKAMSALTHAHSGVAAGNNARSFATRASSPGADGSGAPSGRRLAVLGAAVLALSLALAAPAMASKTVHSFWGNTGFPPSGAELDGGIFSNPRDVAVNVNGAGPAAAGDIYVANQFARRIEVFSASGSFIRAFGRDVIESGKANDNGTGFEICDTTAGNVATDCREGTGFPAEGGTLGSPQGIAIDQDTGDVYVTNRDLRRVEVFDASGNFLRAFGQNVVASGANDSPASSAQQTLTVDATEGQLQLTFRGQTSADIAFNASAEELDAALEALSTVGAGNVAVSGGPGGAGGASPYLIAFSGALANAPMPLISAADGTTPLGGGAGASTEHTTTGATGFEVCVAGADTCQAGASAATAGAFASTFDGYLELAPAGAPNAGNVLVADRGNNRVSEYTAAGAFVRSFGWDVTASPPNSTTGFETCDASNLDVCKAGAAGAGVGQFAGEFAGEAVSRVAVDSSGAVYTVEPFGNFRVQKFTPSGGTLVPSVFAAGVLSGTGSGDAPTHVAIGGSDHVFVTKVFAAGAGTPPADAEEERVLELDPSGTLLDTHASQAGIRLLNGLTANPANGRLYLTRQLNPQRLYVLADAATPTATVDPVTGASATTATFNGKVNPGGVIGEHRFEYVDNATYLASGFAEATQLPLEDSGNGSTASAVSRLVKDLDPSTLYHVRLFVRHRFGTESATSGETTFTTGPSAPTVAPFGVADAGQTQAALYARVTANSQPTTYVFQWGPTAAYGNTTAVQSAGSGADSVLGSAQISGLSPDTTYHFRLVATNASGTTAGPDQTFTTEAPEPGACTNTEFRTGPGADLPECRAYEQVSPVDKNGGDVAKWIGTVAADGSRAVLSSTTEFAGATSGGDLNLTEYIAHRRPSEWVTEELSPPVVPAGAGRSPLMSSIDLSRTLITSSGLLQVDPPYESSEDINLYMRDNETRVVTPFLSMPSAFGLTLGTATTPAFDRLVQSTSRSLANVPGAPGEEIVKVYETVNGETRLVSILPDGTPYPTYAQLGSLPVINTELISSTTGAVSEDGKQIFFTGYAGGQAPAFIYRRSGGATTELGSPSTRTPADPQAPGKKYFALATPDGNRVLFASSALLTDDANTGPAQTEFNLKFDLYRYDFDADRLLNLSAIPEGDGSRVRGVLGSDDEAERVYYVALGQVVPGEGAEGQPNLFLWEDDGTSDGHTRFLATLSSADTGIWSDPENPFVRVSSDGRYLLFASEAVISGGETNGMRQLYRYDAEGNGGTGDLECVSCNPEGDTPLGGVTLYSHGAGNSAQSWEQPHTLTPDGRRVFFTTLDDLLPQDTNEKLDAYMWDEGELQLLSTGTSDRDSVFYNASVDGKDAFILTAEALVPQDGDELMDLYTAHVGGGLASQFATPAPGCSGEECRGAGTSDPPGPPPLSFSLQGAGNLAPRSTCARPSRAAKRLSRRAKGLRRKAAVIRRRGNARRSVRIQRRAQRFGKRAQRMSKRAKRCRARARAERRAQR